MSALALGFATLGLQAISTIGAASGGARASRASIKGNNKAINLINQNLSLIPEIAQSKSEGAYADMNLEMQSTAKEAKDSNRDAFMQYEEALGAGGFAKDFKVDDAYGDFQKQLNDSFSVQRKSLFHNLDKNLSSITEWQLSTEGKMEAEKQKLEAENRVLRTKDTFFENIF